jgi:hypothetical protein
MSSPVGLLSRLPNMHEPSCTLALPSSPYCVGFGAFFCGGEVLGGRFFGFAARERRRLKSLTQRLTNVARPYVHPPPPPSEKPSLALVALAAAGAAAAAASSASSSSGTQIELRERIFVLFFSALCLGVCA